MKTLGSAFFALLLLMAPSFAQADCSALFNDLMNYAQTPTVGNCMPNFNTLYVKMATNRSDNRYVSFAQGYTTQKITGGGRFPLIPSFGGTLTQTFSDRNQDYYTTRCDSGSFCFPTTQNFAVTHADQLGVSFMNNNATLTLKSWGNGSFNVDLTCSASGIMYGEKDGTLFTFSFQKTVYQNTCIR